MKYIKNNKLSYAYCNSKNIITNTILNKCIGRASLTEDVIKDTMGSFYILADTRSSDLNKMKQIRNEIIKHINYEK